MRGGRPQRGTVYFLGAGKASCILLLTPFTSAKVTQVAESIEAVSKAAVNSANSVTHGRRPHIVHVGVHCDASHPEHRVAHESWQLEAEKVIEEKNPQVFSSWTHLRINFDGYNGLLKPGEISYFLPANERSGWIAREDIAAVAAAVLLEPHKHMKQVYSLSTESLSLSDMAAIVTGMCGFEIGVRSLTSDDFTKLALSMATNPDRDQRYVDYTLSVQSLFEGLNNGLFLSHRATFPDTIRRLCGKDFTSFRQWLMTSSYKSKLYKQ